MQCTARPARLWFRRKTAATGFAAVCVRLRSAGPPNRLAGAPMYVHPHPPLISDICCNVLHRVKVTSQEAVIAGRTGRSVIHSVETATEYENSSPYYFVDSSLCVCGFHFTLYTTHVCALFWFPLNL